MPTPTSFSAGWPESWQSLLPWVWGAESSDERTGNRSFGGQVCAGHPQAQTAGNDARSLHQRPANAHLICTVRQIRPP
eukprot:282659-Alexandrium_andersonii.AAC.1